MLRAMVILDLIDSEDSSSTKDSIIDFVITDDLRLIAL